jgi:ribosomal protein S18 acetylase RimI-like enzyme
MSLGDDLLRDMAENRGCKLVRSRVRTPGRGDYGKFGLRDAKSGEEVLGFGQKGLTATAEEVEAFLRGGAASAWQSSVGKAPARKQGAARATPEPQPKAEPKLIIRDARPSDIDALVGLIVALGYAVTAAELRKRLALLKKAGQHVLVADRGGAIGVLTTSTMQVLHRPRPVGRISMMVVAEAARSGGVGAALVGEAEARLKAAGCGLVEVTSNAKRLRAHAFYERLGYERTSIRLAKQLQE